jgi:hypothetical protein
MKLKPGLVDEIERLVLNASVRRQAFLTTARRKSAIKRLLTFVSGLLALLSAAAITSVLTDFVGGKGLQIVAAASAAISGVSSLILAVYINETDIAQMFNAATSFLSLRERVHLLSLDPAMTSAQVYEALKNLQQEYAELDAKYQKHYQKSGWSRQPSSFRPIPKKSRKIRVTTQALGSGSVRSEIKQLNDKEDVSVVDNSEDK